MTDRDGFVEQSLELIGRLETAEVGSRELDRDIDRAFPSPGTPPAYEWPLELVPAYTTSLDAALALAERVLPDHDVQLTKGRHEDALAAIGHYLSVHHDEATARTLPLALCIAILKARATPEGMRKPLEDMETGR